MLAPELLERPRDTRPRPERGAVAVEFALVLPILVMLLLGITTAGLSFTRAIGVTNAVREGTRFGATTDATAGTTWADAVIERVRSTQFDDGSTAASSSTSVCVQLYNSTTGAPQVPTRCSQGSQDAPLEADVSSALSSLTIPNVGGSGSCVVRVVAARKFTINTGLSKWTRVNQSSSVARFERFDKVTACK